MVILHSYVSLPEGIIELDGKIETGHPWKPLKIDPHDFDGNFPEKNNPM